MTGGITDFGTRLSERIRGGTSPAVVGLDPRLEALPSSVEPSAPPGQRILAFYREVVPVLARHVGLVKPNIAFFEQFGHLGYRAYEETCELARRHGMIVIGDVKRGDIGSTAEAYARAHFAHADAVTLHPYLGIDSIRPFLAHCEPRAEPKGVFVLVRTSNPSAAELQDLSVSSPDPTSVHSRLCDAVAERVAEWGKSIESEGYGPVGAVVGATWPDDLAKMRAAMPDAWMLLPGVGAQGATVRDTAAAFDDSGLGALINQSRGVMQCFAPDDADWRDRMEAAAESFAAECRALVAERSAS